MSESEHMLPMHLHLSRSDEAFEPQNVAYAKLTFAPRKHLHRVMLDCVSHALALSYLCAPLPVLSSYTPYSACFVRYPWHVTFVQLKHWLTWGVWPYDHQLPGIQEIYGGEYSEHKTLHALTVNHWWRKEPINIFWRLRFLHSLAQCFNKPKDTLHCTTVFRNSVYYEIVVDSASSPMILLL